MDASDKGVLMNKLADLVDENKFHLAVSPTYHVITLRMLIETAINDKCLSVERTHTYIFATFYNNLFA